MPKSESPPPRRRRSPSKSPSRSPPPKKRDDDDASINPGNNLYVSGLSVRVTEEQLRQHFEKEGKVLDARLVLDPRTKESRGFGFVTMATLEDADRAVKYLNKSVLEGRVLACEKAKRKRERTPTPGSYLGMRGQRDSGSDRLRRGDERDYHDRDRDRDYRDRDRDRDRDHPRDRDRDHRRRASPRYSPYRNRSRSRSPRYRR